MIKLKYMGLLKYIGLSIYTIGLALIAFIYDLKLALLLFFIMFGYELCSYGVSKE